jgi:hypothetical protein
MQMEGPAGVDRGTEQVHEEGMEECSFVVVIINFHAIMLDELDFVFA